MKSRFIILPALAFAHYFSGMECPAEAQEFKPPILCLPCDEIKGGQTPNCGSVFAEVLASTTNLAEGKFGKSLAFTSTSSYLLAELNLNDAAPYGFSVSCWFNMPGQAGYQVLLCSGDGNHGFILRAKDKDNFEFTVANTWHTVCINHNHDLCARWNHVVATYDLKTARLFLNGVLVNERNLQSKPAFEEKVTIGRSSALIKSINQATGQEEYSWNAFHGSLDNIKIFDYALTPEQAAKLDE